MNSKDRVKTALSFVEPDRVPISATYVPEVEKKLRSIVGYDELDLGVAMGNDLVLIPVGFSTGYYLKDEEFYTCEWGCKWRTVKTATGIYTEIYERPLNDKKDLVNYKVPDANDENRYNHAERVIGKYGKDYWIVGSIPTTIFECAWALRGLDNLLMDMMLDKEFAHELMDKVMEFSITAGKRLIDLGVDMLWTGDDVAMQNGMMMSLEMWREFLKPRYKRMFNEFKLRNPQIKIAYHSDGNCEAILDEMYEIGLDIINPIQPLCMDPVEIKENYGKKLAMWGALCVQRVMPFGTTETVKEEVKRLKVHCGKGGGFILAPAHNIQSDTSVENILAFYEEAIKG